MQQGLEKESQGITRKENLDPTKSWKKPTQGKEIEREIKESVFGAVGGQKLNLHRAVG